MGQRHRLGYMLVVALNEKGKGVVSGVVSVDLVCNILFAPHYKLLLYIHGYSG
jgi:hypothetical protein